jgi:hypothetical protein
VTPAQPASLGMSTYDIESDSPSASSDPPPPADTALPPPPAGGTPAPTSSGGPILRDRIIVLGRRRSGKTVFLARLYERLWTSRGEIHMAAVDGQTHLGLLSQLDAMEKKRWPASTETMSHFKIDITYRGEKFLMVALDYPGEVFRRAFMEGSDEPAVRELLENIDRAAAAIVLVDPGVMFEGDRIEQADQDFGLVAAIKRMRDWPGAESIPVALTLTKCDRYRDELDEAGGISRFVKDKYSNLYRCAFQRGRQGMAFACAAVRSKKDGLGREIPDLSKPPKGLIEPLQYCLEHMRARRVEIGRREQAEAVREAEKIREIEEAEADRKLSRLTAWLVGGGLAVVVIGGIVAWKVLS